MKICGIVAEYNPFHLGHARQLAAARAMLGEDCALVCAMGGDFTQRGGPAVFAKHPRAEAAVRGGADLVLELP
ncbi:MAG: nucleotidyltransferase family protein, partial [Oscillospiraceae bacterium]|nr:nucleotidyltransferase family protein [Oscillospiraceae bacterium]